MVRADEFRTFLGLYNEVVHSTVLTHAEKIAAVEAAANELIPRAAPGAYHAIIKRLTLLPIPKEDHADTATPNEGPSPRAADPKERSAGRVGPKVRRGSA